MNGKNTLAVLLYFAAALFVALAVFGAAPAAAQQTAQTTPQTETVAPEGEGEEEEEGRRSGPEMQRLFFTAEQRRVLEALRQGLVESELLEDDEFVPVVLREEAFIADEEEEVIVERGDEALRFTGMVRRNSDGKAFIWINGGEPLDVGEEAEYLDKVRNLVLTEEQTIHEGITGIDKFTRRRFKVLIGQSISTDGQVREDLPVVEINKKN